MYAVVCFLLTFVKPAPHVYKIRDLSTVTPVPVADTSGRININTATAEELISLPGIGEKTAQAIIQLREELRGFCYPEDLLLVSGIGEKKLDAIYDLIYVK